MKPVAISLYTRTIGRRSRYAGLEADHRFGCRHDALTQEANVMAVSTLAIERRMTGKRKCGNWSRGVACVHVREEEGGR